MIRPIIADKGATLHIIRTFGIKLHKKLGQNFLINPDIVSRIVQAAELTAQDTVLEIGPGIGTLTQGLAETGSAIVAVEIDRRLIAILNKTLAGYDNVRVIHGDIMNLDISREILSPKYKVVANLPYYITTPIIMRLLEERLPIELIVTMVQKEVAERIVAKPGTKDYGALSVAVQYYTEPKIIMTVPSDAFVPPPAVESSVLRCRVRSEPAVIVKDEKDYFRVVKASFAQRRKTLNNVLTLCGMTKTEVQEVLAIAEVDGMRRGETCSLQDFARIADAWFEMRRQR